VILHMKPFAASQAREIAVSWLFILLAAFILFAHGCHGRDVDHELRGPASPQFSVK